MRKAYFGTINWIEDSPLIDKINLNMSHNTIENTEVSDFITSSKWCDINPLVNIFWNHIINKIIAIPTPISGIKDKIKEKFKSHGEFSVKSVTWANNDKITTHQKASS